MSRVKVTFKPLLKAFYLIDCKLLIRTLRIYNGNITVDTNTRLIIEDINVDAVLLAVNFRT